MDSDTIPLLHPRILMYSQDGFGLGHMRRMTLIADQVLRLRQDACILTLADSRLGQFFQTASNHDYLKLPSIVKVGPGDWRAVNLSLPFADVHSMRRDLIRSAALNYRPHIFLVDHMPHGAMGELLPTLEALKAIGTKIVLGLRDILDAPEVVQRRWYMEGAYAAMENYYDLVLVYGRSEVFNMAEQYCFPPVLNTRPRYCGYICTPAHSYHATKLRKKYLTTTTSNTKLIVAMAGGGADAYPMMRALLDTLPTINTQQSCALVLITGPFMPKELRKELQAHARNLPVHIVITTNDTVSFINAADLVVAMAGYNTTMEILQSGKPAILIPRNGPSAEQRMRATLFAAREWARMLDPTELSTDRLAQTVINSLGPTPNVVTENKPDLHGLSAVVAELLSLLPAASTEGEMPMPSVVKTLNQPPAIASAIQKV